MKVINRILIVLCFCSLAAAADSAFMFWTGNGSNDIWTNSANWNGTYVPDTNNYAIIDYTANGNPIVSTDIADVYKGVRCGVYSEQQAILTIAADGHLRMKTDPINGYLAVGYDTGTSAVCNMTGGEITAHRILVPRAGYGEFNLNGGTLSLTHAIRMGEQQGHQGGIFDMSNGTINMSANGQYISVGYELGAPTTFNISGGTINLVSLEMGRRGKGTCNISDGTLNLQKIRIGYDTSGATVAPESILNIEGGTIHVDTYCAVGFWRTVKPCQLNMSGGTLYAQDLTVGWHGEGLINLTGGTIIVNDAYTNGLVRFGGGTDPTGKGGKLNLAGGELRFHGNDTIFHDSVDAGDIVAYNGSGRVLIIYDYDPDWTYVKADPNIAHSPVPDNNAIYVNPALAALHWTNPFAGQTVYCDVYISTDPAMVMGVNQLVNHGAVNSASVAVNPQATYYWRVDTHNPVTDEQYTGVVWKFATNNIGAQDPQPANNATDVPITQPLSWSITGDFDTVKVYTCQGTNPASLTLKSTQSVVDTDYVETLANNKTYLWRVDAVKGSITTTGAVWKFTTVNPKCLMVGTSGDINGDCKVNFIDFAELAANWMTCSWDHSDYCGMEEN